MPKFSIIIPVYNVAPYLHECLDSVLAQTFTDWEAICVDDGSTDESGAVLDQFAAKDSRIRVFRQRNSGAGAARNCGLENASGDWIGFVDSDDVVDKDWLSRCREATTGVTFYDSIVWGYQSFKDTRDINLGSDSSVSVGNKDLWRNMFRKEVVEGIRFANFVLGEDILFVKMCQDKAQSTYDLEKKLYGYRLRTGSLLHSQLDLRKAKDEIAWRHAWLRLMRDSSRVYSSREFRGLALCLTEGVASVICVAAPDVLRQVCSDWFALLLEAKNVTKFPLWFRFSMTLVSLTKSIALAWVLFYFPYWLKKKGVHR